MNYRLFFEEAATKMYPSVLLHSYGVNGKISGSVGAVGEMSGGVAAVLHAPLGCGFHYRFSARRRHQPFFRLFSTDLTEQEIVFGGREKLLRTVRSVWERYAPALIYIIPSPVTDVLNEDIPGAAETLRAEGVPAVAVQSELFSHRDKSYARRRMKELASLKISGDNRLEMELKGCGFTEALWALVEQVMEPQVPEPGTINIETVGWGSEGMAVLREIGDFLAGAGVRVNCWIPSSDLEALKKAPAARLNLVKRVRWARRMRERFGTDYLHLNDSGRYAGLDGVARFYMDVGEKLGIAGEVAPLVEKARTEALAATAEARAALGKYRCALLCRGLQTAPFTLKTYAHSLGLGIGCVCVLLTDEMRASQGMTPELEEKFMGRLREAVELYSPGTEIVMNPTEDELRRRFSALDAAAGTDDFTLEGLGAPLINTAAADMSLSFPSYVRAVERLARRMENRKPREELLLGRMPFTPEHYPRLENTAGIAARELWERMWLNRDREVEQ